MEPDCVRRKTFFISRNSAILSEYQIRALTVGSGHIFRHRIALVGKWNGSEMLHSRELRVQYKSSTYGNKIPQLIYSLNDSNNRNFKFLNFCH